MGKYTGCLFDFIWRQIDDLIIYALALILKWVIVYNTIKWNIYTSLVLSQSKQFITTTVYHNNFFYFQEFFKINKKHCITIIVI